jgi:hypothetical protein
MKIGGAHEVKERLFKEDILSRGSQFSIDIKRGEKYHKHEERGRSPKESYPFPLMSKGERNMILFQSRRET